MRLFAKIAILVLILSMAGEFCAHAEVIHMAEAQANQVCFAAADNCCSDHEACEHDSCSCHCLCHVPAASPGALCADASLMAHSKVAELDDASTCNLSQPQERPPIYA